MGRPKTNPTTCTVSDCTRRVNSRGLCAGHYRRLRVHGDVNVAHGGFAEKPCRRCGETFAPTSANHRYCSPECARQRGVCEGCGAAFVAGKKTSGRFCSYACYVERGIPLGSKRPYNEGYVRIKVPAGTPGAVTTSKRWAWIPEHRHVMQQRLDRPLFRGENVHHVNGVRDDNRPENLELWVTSQPSGQRVEDHVAWATEILRRYAPERLT